MEPVPEFESLSHVFNSLSKLPFDSKFTRLRLCISGTQNVVAEIDELGFSCIFTIGVLPHSFFVANKSLESTSAITLSCPR